MLLFNTPNSILFQIGSSVLYQTNDLSFMRPYISLLKFNCEFLEENIPAPCKSMLSESRVYTLRLDDTYICIFELDHQWFRHWLGTCSVPSLCLNHCWPILNRTLWNKPQWNLNQNIQLFFQQNAFENVVCKMSAILFQSLCVKEVVPKLLITRLLPDEAFQLAIYWFC